MKDIINQWEKDIKELNVLNEKIYLDRKTRIKNRAEKEVTYIKTFYLIILIGNFIIIFNLFLSKKDIIYNPMELIAAIIISTLIVLADAIILQFCFYLIIASTQKIVANHTIRLYLRSLIFILTGLLISIITSPYNNLLWYLSAFNPLEDLIRNLLELNPVALLLTILSIVATADALINRYEHTKNFFKKVVENEVNSIIDHSSSIPDEPSMKTDNLNQ